MPPGELPRRVRQELRGELEVGGCTRLAADWSGSHGGVAAQREFIGQPTHSALSNSHWGIPLSGTSMILEDARRFLRLTDLVRQLLLICAAAGLTARAVSRLAPSSAFLTISIARRLPRRSPVCICIFMYSN